MKTEKRKHQRMEDIGKVEAPDLCHFPGVLVDVSKLGCRARFPISFLVNMDVEYELKISPVRFSCVDSFFIMARPIWQKATEDSTEVGFTILHSPSFKKFDSYVDKLITEKQNFETEQEFLDGIK